MKTNKEFNSRFELLLLYNQALKEILDNEVIEKTKLADQIALLKTECEANLKHAEIYSSYLPTSHSC